MTSPELPSPEEQKQIDRMVDVQIKDWQEQKAPIEICELCEKEITDSREVMYPHGHHGEPVQCLGCYSSGLDYARDGMESL